MTWIRYSLVSPRGSLPQAFIPLRSSLEKLKESHRQVSQITKKEKKNYNILIINNHNNIADKRMPVAEKTAGHQDSF